MQPQFQNNRLQTLKQKRAHLLWTELLPQSLLGLALLFLCLRAHFFFFWWGLMPFGKTLQQKYDELTKLNTQIKQHIAQSGFRIEDEYPPRMVRP